MGENDNNILTLGKVRTKSVDWTLASDDSLRQFGTRNLRNKAEALQNLHTKKSTINTLADVKAFLQDHGVQISQQPLLALHVNLANDIKHRLQHPVFRKLLAIENQLIQALILDSASRGVSAQSYVTLSQRIKALAWNVSKLRDSVISAPLKRQLRNFFDDIADLGTEGIAAPVHVVRLLCLGHVLCRGLELGDDLEAMSESTYRIIVATCGLAVWRRFVCLHMGGVLGDEGFKRNRGGSARRKSVQESTWGEVQAALNIVVQPSDPEQSPPQKRSSSDCDLAAAYEGMIPVSVRLAQLLMEGGVGGSEFSRALRVVSSEMADVRIPGLRARAKQSNDEAQPKTQKSHIMALVMLGGITHAEIAAIRALERRNNTTKLLIVTTDLISAESFLSSF